MVAIALTASPCFGSDDRRSSGTAHTGGSTVSSPSTLPTSVSGPDRDGRYDEVAEVAAAWERCWQAIGPSEYQLTVDLHGMSGTASRVSHVVDGDPIESHGPGDGALTLENVWDLIDGSILVRPDHLTVRFDPDGCHPVSIGIDDDRAVIDDEGGYSIHLEPMGNP